MEQRQLCIHTPAPPRPNQPRSPAHLLPPNVSHPPLPQTLVFKLGLAKSIHHARVLIRQRHIRVGKQIVNIPSFMVRVDSQVRAVSAGLSGSRCRCGMAVASQQMGLGRTGQRAPASCSVAANIKVVEATGQGLGSNVHQGSTQNSGWSELA